MTDDERRAKSLQMARNRKVMEKTDGRIKKGEALKTVYVRAANPALNDQLTHVAIGAAFGAVVRKLPYAGEQSQFEVRIRARYLPCLKEGDDLVVSNKPFPALQRAHH